MAAEKEIETKEKESTEGAAAAAANNASAELSAEVFRAGPGASHDSQVLGGKEDDLANKKPNPGWEEILRQGGDKTFISDRIMHPWHGITTKTDGTHDLRTGDRLVVRDGKETLVTPTGDIVTVNKDGSVKVEGAVKEVSVDKDGNQVYTMSDGAKITIGKSGINSVSRDGESAHLMQNIKLNPYAKPNWRDLEMTPKPNHYGLESDLLKAR